MRGLILAHSKQLKWNTMAENKNTNEVPGKGTNQPLTNSTSRQEQADPPITELRGFFDPKEDIEPTLTDGSKAPEKAEDENRQNKSRSAE
jgi:hypothetical protein